MNFRVKGKDRVYKYHGTFETEDGVCYRTQGAYGALIDDCERTTDPEWQMVSLYPMYADYPELKAYIESIGADYNTFDYIFNVFGTTEMLVKVKDYIKKLDL